MTSQNYKKKFLSSLMKLGISVGYKFLVENLNFGVNQCISGHVISQNMEFIRLAISQPLFKDRDFWFGPKNYIKLCTDHFTTLVCFC